VKREFRGSVNSWYMVKFVGLFFKYKKLWDAKGYLTENILKDLRTRINDL
jgi:hypothetical protein